MRSRCASTTSRADTSPLAISRASSTGAAAPQLLGHALSSCSLARTYSRRHVTTLAAMRVPLPDGSVRELPDGSTGADLAADIGPASPGPRMAIRVLDGRARRRSATGRPTTTAGSSTSSLPLGDGAAGRDRHRQGRRRRRAEAAAPRHRARARGVGARALSRAPRCRSARRSPTASTTTSSSRPASRSTRATSRRSRRRCASTSRPTSRSSAPRSPPARRSSATCARTSRTRSS